jgi:hypothetical protein
LRFRHSPQQRLVAVAPEGGQVLLLAHQCRKRIGAGGKARPHLRDGGRSGGLLRPLRHDESFTAELGRGLELVACRCCQIGDMMNKEIRTLLDETACAIIVPRAARLGVGMSNYGSRGPA